MFFIRSHHLIKRSLPLLLLSFLLINCNLSAAATSLATVTLAWLPPSKRIDGSPLSIGDFGYYTLHVIMLPDILYSKKIIGDPYQTQLVINNVERNKTYFIAVEVTDDFGTSSGLSNFSKIQL